jgi:hypothetical protein
MTNQISASNFTVSRETLRQAANCNQTWRELYTAIQTRLRVEIEPAITMPPDFEAKGDTKWQAA